MPPRNRTGDLVTLLSPRGRCATRAELVAGFSTYALAEARRRGDVAQVLPSVFAHTAHAASFETRIGGLGLWLPQHCYVSGVAALRLLELTEVVPGRITVVAGRNQRLRGPKWLRVARNGPLRTLEWRGGVHCAARERAVIDAWVESADRDRVSVVLEAMRRSSLKGSAVLRELATMPRVRGRRELVRVLNEASEGIQSYLEHRAHRTVLNTKDFNGLQRQVTFTAMGKTYTVDTYDPATRTVIEFDGAKVHGSRERKAYDNARDAALATLGILTIRIGYDEVMTRPEWCREVIRRAIAARTGGQ